MRWLVTEAFVSNVHTYVIVENRARMVIRIGEKKTRKIHVEILHGLIVCLHSQER